MLMISPIFAERGISEIGGNSLAFWPQFHCAVLLQHAQKLLFLIFRSFWHRH